MLLVPAALTLLDRHSLSHPVPYLIPFPYPAPLLLVREVQDKLTIHVRSPCFRFFNPEHPQNQFHRRRNPHLPPSSQLPRELGSLTVPRTDTVWARTRQKNQNGQHSYEPECHHGCLHSIRRFLHSLGFTFADRMRSSSLQ